ncbi:MAG: GNAT family N-acetyltransferase [Fulvivirga sp.]
MNEKLSFETIENDAYPLLIEIWEASVRATHHFLKEEDINTLKPLILEHYLDAVALRVSKNENDEILGFMGVAADNLEMLFLHPHNLRKGIGKQMLRYAIQEMGVKKVDVNEQNKGAIAFYLQSGFKVTGRSEKDPLGKPYPILHMSLEAC